MLVEKKLTKKQIKKLEKRRIKKLFIEWTERVKLRDSHMCVICKSTEYIHTHHLIVREFKPLRFDIDNGVCLCAKHHKFSLENSPHRNPLVFVMWLLENRPAQTHRLYDKYNESKTVI